MVSGPSLQHLVPVAQRQAHNLLHSVRRMSEAAEDALLEGHAPSELVRVPRKKVAIDLSTATPHGVLCGRARVVRMCTEPGVHDFIVVHFVDMEASLAVRHTLCLKVLAKTVSLDTKD